MKNKIRAVILCACLALSLAVQVSVQAADETEERMQEVETSANATAQGGINPGGQRPGGRNPGGMPQGAEGNTPWGGFDPQTQQPPNGTRPARPNTENGYAPADGQGADGWFGGGFMGQGTRPNAGADGTQEGTADGTTSPWQNQQMPGGNRGTRPQGGMGGQGGMNGQNGMGGMFGQNGMGGMFGQNGQGQPFGTQEGTDTDVTQQSFNLVKTVKDNITPIISVMLLGASFVFVIFYRRKSF